MNGVEERLRAAYQAVADTVTQDMELPELTGAGETRARARRLGPPGRVVRLTAPLAAAAAVAAIAVTLALVATSGRGPAPEQSSGLLPWRLPAATSVRQGYPGGHIPVVAAPKYFLGMQPARHGPTEYAFAVYVYSAATGKQTGQVTLPGSGLWAQAVTGLGDDTYVVAATKDRPRYGCRTWLFQFHLTAAGRPTGLKAFRVPQVRGWVRELNGSGNGHMAVITASACSRGRAQPMNVHDARATAISLPAGTTASWSPWPAGSNLVPENLASSGALSADGRLLPFVAIAGQPADFGPDTQAAYVMPSRPPARYHLVLNPSGTAGVVSDALSPNGRVAFVMTARRYGGRWHEMIGAYATTTGKLLRVLASSSSQALDGNGFLVPDPSGRYLLVLGLGAGNTGVLDVATDRLSAVPVRYPYPPLGVSW